jgi:cellulose synthase/poly-beta-1,6-N-acetylglucosamine synthase-like glycosyltransferase
VVGISSFTVIGLIIASFVIPPLGVILGILFKFSKDDDTRDLGGKMIMAAIVAIVLFAINLLVGLLSGLKAVQPRPERGLSGE